MTKVSLTTLFLLLMSATAVMAQTEMADVMRADGKIYVVVVVLATIFAGIFAYLIHIDRKITNIEKENNIN